ncbi:hypothetical protein KSF78_0004826 [Schistosoma japonicum]|nr:hypothetical protein KSF78_0004826 [Schistosoma japonicum]KAH8875995.1 hypothetical protein KSF78_0004826 [Schistosoma japonicum]KAH8875997.1 hypothetical protein KSF78_0004826 [Schistosoma japonicum]
MDNITHSDILGTPLSDVVNSRKYHKKHSKFVSSTPLNEGQNHQNNSFIKQESRTFFSINERLANLLDKVLPLKKKWSTNFHQSCIIYTNLATYIYKILPESPAFENHDDTVTYALCDLYFNDNVEQLTKFRHGQVLETYYDKLDDCIKNMEDCGVQLKSMMNQFNALRRLDQNESIYQLATCQSDVYSSIDAKNNNSTSEYHDDTNFITLNATQSFLSSLKQEHRKNSSSTFLYESLIIEIDGLIKQIDRDVNIRKYLMKIILPMNLHYYHFNLNTVNKVNSTNDNDVLLKLVSIWRHFGQYVTWWIVLSISKHILSIISKIQSK